MTAIAALINGFGLALGIIGALLVWKHGVPPSDIEEDHLLFMSSPDPEEIDEKKNLHRRRSKTGMLVLAIGFVFQFAGNLMALF